jgi:hypothetical protein
MGSLFTVCPVTRRKIDIGVDTDRQTLARTPQFVGRLHCPFCGHEHNFSKDDVLIRETVNGAEHYLRAA